MSDISQESDFIFYNSPDGRVNVPIIIGDETVWTTQSKIADIFGTTKQNVSSHIQNIYESGELDKSATVKEMLTVQNEGGRQVSRNLDFFNLDVIIAVGYRVNSYQATQFRIWATKTLKEYLIKGFAMDDERLKQGKKYFGKDYFAELLERIREIRNSERLFYQKITDLYAESTDYDPSSPITHKFYATVQNKLHWAIHGHTGAELIKERANFLAPNMGLTSWKNHGKGGKILQSDARVAKNYLTKEELDSLNRLVSMYLDFAENLIARKVVMTMKDWAQRLDSFLQFNEYDLLQDAGRVSHEVAMKLADSEYDKFRVVQDKNFISDFDKVVVGVISTGHLPKETPPQTESASHDKPKNFGEIIKKISKAGKPQKNEGGE